MAMQRAHAFVGFSAFAASLVILAACASSGGTGTTVAEPDSSAPKTNRKPPTPVPPPVVVVVADAAPPRVCLDSCISDEDCANSCPSVSSGSQCCDVETGSCYRSSENVCPLPQVRDAGGGGMY